MKYKCAGIVLYNPNLDRLKENIDSVYKQVDVIIIVDNNSKNFNQFLNLYKYDSKILIIKNDENKGIATALNQLSIEAKNLGYEWIMFLDQDSICCDNIMDLYKPYINKDKLALICPYIVDINKMTLNDFVNLGLPKTSSLLWAITSGSLVKIEVLLKLGGFEEYLFIDGVDIEYSKRLKVNGYKQLRINKAYLLQEVGKADILKIKRIHKDMAGTITWKPLYRTNHSSIRQYYMARNDIIIAKKYRKYQSYTKNIVKVILMNIIKIMIERDKKEKTKSIFKGLYDGFKYEVVPYKRMEGKR